MRETANGTRETVELGTSRHSTAYMRVRTAVRTALGVVGLGVLLAAASWADAPLHDEPMLPECVTEDAAGPCIWHADRHGNGTGRSFTGSDDGAVIDL